MLLQVFDGGAVWVDKAPRLPSDLRQVRATIRPIFFRHFDSANQFIHPVDQISWHLPVQVPVVGKQVRPDFQSSVIKQLGDLLISVLGGVGSVR